MSASIPSRNVTLSPRFSAAGFRALIGEIRKEKDGFYDVDVGWVWQESVAF
jgi:hypothetical protein